MTFVNILLIAVLVFMLLLFAVRIQSNTPTIILLRIVPIIFIITILVALAPVILSPENLTYITAR